MPNHFQQYGKQLLANGYLIVPIRPGAKYPALSAWQRARLGPGDLGAYPNHGVGLLCGQGANPIVGVDIDVSHPVIGPKIIEWCETHLGETASRVGAAPRILFVYRAADGGWTKGNSQQFFDPADPIKPSGKENHQQIEILGNGQQFVAYHTHPDTGQDYEWVDIFGGLESYSARDLPVVTQDQIAELLAEFARLIRETPGITTVGSSESPVYSSDEADDLVALSQPVGTPIDEMEKLLDYLPNENADYDTWLHVGASLHHEYGGTAHDERALELWKAFGAKSDKDDPRQYDYKWRSFGGHSGAPATLRWLLKVCNQAKRDAVQDSLRESLEQAKALIAEQPDSVALGSKTLLEKLRNLIPDDPLSRTEIVSAYQARYKLVSKAHLPITQARTMLLGHRQATVQLKRPLTEFGNADRMLDRFGGGIMYVPEIERWFKWDGNYWKRAYDVDLEHMAKETIRGLKDEQDQHDDAAEFFQFCAVSQQARMVKNMVHIASSDPRVYVPLAQLDANRHLLGVANGVVDLTTGQLLPARPEYYITVTTGVNYNPTAKCPLYQKVLADAMFDKPDMIEFVLRTLGYSLMADPREEMMFIPFGLGSNGKSTVFNTAMRALGGYAKSVAPETFVAEGRGHSNAGGPREDLLRMRGARFVYVNEPDEGSELREGIVKAITGGDTITARGIQAKESAEFTPTWVVFMPTNHKPIIKGSDYGIWRRMGLIPFTRRFDEDSSIKKDPTIKEKVLHELEGVLALLVRWALRYQADGLKLPAVMTQARDSYKSEMDLLSEWIGECCVIGQEYSSPMQPLWESWEMFARGRGILNYVPSSLKLARKLDGRFPASAPGGGKRIRLGIALKGVTDVF